MRRPKGIKTKKSVAKRFKITARGKVLRSQAGRRHLCQSKSPKRRRALRGSEPSSQTLVSSHLFLFSDIRPQELAYIPVSRPLSSTKRRQKYFIRLGL
jgi:large subunit ribosomal protein L35